MKNYWLCLSGIKKDAAKAGWKLNKEIKEMLCEEVNNSEDKLIRFRYELEKASAEIETLKNLENS